MTFKFIRHATLIALLSVACTAHAQADPDACKQWKKSFNETAADAKAARTKLKTYMPKGKNPETVAQWKASVDDATFRKILPLVNRIDEANKHGKRLFDLMHQGRCPA
ncbi:hypothetical protein WKR88_27570 [Trinickia caryophylli]|uniref:Uncharacterized protein n=1 Tax=Trinickia caryophylli TaxID=28094 RepID=A0A1X7HC00_TRICW|nr:hypothetical protein [Trinickia caryophylli]PMS13666.1 hypothetical protein C0Z17_01870 [Trinickia caryophylli]TRX14160.1 hypothetical protein FNF07_22860 [Trinickia caryophylli]WQE13982.1 hypothetical protein U0034_25070 [Trinickia caryophylli]SMF83115.1 hypothetical protein SAMN06295900_12916 [Trinickia caryophylli]GLU33537.1 hypothetical protein Busp01_33790 [Trinickia caryophylli]